jgi:hypothetical protein
MTWVEFYLLSAMIDGCYSAVMKKVIPRLLIAT